MARVWCSTIPFFGEFEGKKLERYRFQFWRHVSNYIWVFPTFNNRFQLQMIISISTIFPTKRMTFRNVLIRNCLVWNMFCSMKYFEKMILEFLFNSRMQTIHVLSWSYQLRCVVVAPSSLLDLRLYFTVVWTRDTSQDQGPAPPLLK